MVPLPLSDRSHCARGNARHMALSVVPDYLYIVRVVDGCGGHVNCYILLVTREGLCQSTQHEFA